MVELFFLKKIILYKIIPYALLMISVSYLVFEMIAPKYLKKSFYDFNDKLYFTLFIRPIKKVFELTAKVKEHLSITSSKRKEKKEAKKEVKKNIKTSKKRKKLDKKIDKLNKKVKFRHSFGLIVRYYLRKIFKKDAKENKRNKSKYNNKSKKKPNKNLKKKSIKKIKRKSNHQKIKHNEKRVINVSRQKNIVFNNAQQKHRNRNRRKVG